MKIFTTAQIADLDQYTIDHEPVRSIDLMERASIKVAEWVENYLPSGRRIAVFAGPGNNGGDALAVSRMLPQKIIRLMFLFPDPGNDFRSAFKSTLNG